MLTDQGEELIEGLLTIEQYAWEKLDLLPTTYEVFVSYQPGKAYIKVQKKFVISAQDVFNLLFQIEKQPEWDVFCQDIKVKKELDWLNHTLEYSISTIQKTVHLHRSCSLNTKQHIITYGTKEPTYSPLTGFIIKPQGICHSLVTLYSQLDLTFLLPESTEEKVLSIFGSLYALTMHNVEQYVLRFKEQTRQQIEHLIHNLYHEVFRSLTSASMDQEYEMLMDEHGVKMMFNKRTKRFTIQGSIVTKIPAEVLSRKLSTPQSLKTVCPEITFAETMDELDSSATIIYLCSKSYLATANTIDICLLQVCNTHSSGLLSICYRSIKYEGFSSPPNPSNSRFIVFPSGLFFQPLSEKASLFLFTFSVDLSMFDSLELKHDQAAMIFGARTLLWMNNIVTNVSNDIQVNDDPLPVNFFMNSNTNANFETLKSAKRIYPEAQYFDVLEKFSKMFVEKHSATHQERDLKEQRNKAEPWLVGLNLVSLFHKSHKSKPFSSSKRKRQVSRDSQDYSTTTNSLSYFAGKQKGNIISCDLPPIPSSDDPSPRSKSRRGAWVLSPTEFSSLLTRTRIGKNQLSLEDLSDEVILLIFNSLEARDLAQVSRLSKRFSLIANDRLLWRDLVREHYPCLHEELFPGRRTGWSPASCLHNVRKELLVEQHWKLIYVELTIQHSNWEKGFHSRTDLTGVPRQEHSPDDIDQHPPSLVQVLRDSGLFLCGDANGTVKVFEKNWYDKFVTGADLLTASVESIQGPDSPVVGLSLTPGRAEEDDQIPSLIIGYQCGLILCYDLAQRSKLWEYTPRNKLKGLIPYSSPNTFNNIKSPLTSANRSLLIWDVNVQLFRVSSNNKESLVDVAFNTRPITACCLLSNSSLIAAASANEIGLWDVEGILPPGKLNGHSKKITCLSSRGDYPSSVILSGGSDGFINLWDPRIMNATSCFDQIKTSVTAVAFGSDGLVVSGYNDGNLRVWDPRFPVPLYSLETGNSPITGLSACSSLLLAITKDGRFLCYDFQANSFSKML